MLFASPLNTLFGLDPVWGENFTVYKMHKKITIVEVLVLFFVGAVYLFMKKNKKQELNYL